MTTDSLTPVWEMPTLGMRPSGMQLRRQPEDAIHPTILHQNALIVGTVVGTGEYRFTFIQEEAAKDDRLVVLDRLFESVLADYGAVPSTARPPVKPRVVGREAVVRRVEWLRSALYLTAEETAAIIGLGTRRFYEFVGGKPLPEARLVEIDERVTIVDALAARDWRATVSLIRDHASETVELLDAARLAELQDLFGRIQRERSVLLRDGTGDLVQLAIRHAQDLARILEAPAFDVAAKIVQWIGRSDEHIQDRGKALLELSTTFKALEDDDQVGETWDFLYGLDADQRAAFRRRAETFIREDDFAAGRWQTLLSEESERAWNAATSVRLGSIDDNVHDFAENDAPLPWQLDLSSIGVDFRLYDRRRS